MPTSPPAPLFSLNMLATCATPWTVWATDVESTPPIPLSVHCYDPAATFDLDRDRVRHEMRGLRQRLVNVQRALAPAHLNGVLVILQGMDTAGKDATIRQVFNRLEQSVCRVEYFRTPTPTEAEHDFLWRAHKRIPALGEFVVFHRSYYEDVLFPMVHEAPEFQITQRQRHIRAFEQLLLDSGIVVFKFFLHISPQEQMRRLMRRGRSAKTSWKLSDGDWAERERWDAYMRAYGAVLGQTGTPFAPWHVIPADQKWVRNYLIARHVVEGLETSDYLTTWNDALAARHAERKANKRKGKANKDRVA